MLIGRGEAEGRQLLLLGLSQGNIDRLVRDKPIKLTPETHPGIPDGWEIALIYGQMALEPGASPMIVCGESVQVHLPDNIATGFVHSIQPKPDLEPKLDRLGEYGDIVVTIRVLSRTPIADAIHVQPVYGESLVGPTGSYPRGRMGPEDRGGVRAAIAADVPNRRVQMDFGTNLNWLSMTPEEAIAWAEKLTAKARVVMEATK